MYTQEDILYRSILVATVVISVIILCFLLSVIWQQRKWGKANVRKMESEIDRLDAERSLVVLGHAGH